MEKVAYLLSNVLALKTVIVLHVMNDQMFIVRRMFSDLRCWNLKKEDS